MEDWRLGVQPLSTEIPLRPIPLPCPTLVPDTTPTVLVCPYCTDLHYSLPHLSINSTLQHLSHPPQCHTHPHSALTWFTYPLLYLSVPVPPYLTLPSLLSPLSLLPRPAPSLTFLVYDTLWWFPLIVSLVCMIDRVACNSVFNRMDLLHVIEFLPILLLI